jgi:hypothetical protein
MYMFAAHHFSRAIVNIRVAVREFSVNFCSVGRKQARLWPTEIGRCVTVRDASGDAVLEDLLIWRLQSNH